MKLMTYIRNPIGVAKGIIKRTYNHLIQLEISNKHEFSDHKEFNEIIDHCIKPTDINDHLIHLFVESLSMQPKLIVELGVRGGESTFVFERVAKLCNSKLISVDIEDCSNISSLKNWIFIRKDDIIFAKEFKKWCKDRKMNPKIDILFIDTSHLFEHTLNEIKLWFPFLSRGSKVFFHDTNLNNTYFRKNGTMDFGWDNKRGVISAIEKFLDVRFNEKEEFVAIRNNWLIKHYPYCNGFTILEKLI